MPLLETKAFPEKGFPVQRVERVSDTSPVAMLASVKLFPILELVSFHQDAFQSSLPGQFSRDQNHFLSTAIQDSRSWASFTEGP